MKKNVLCEKGDEITRFDGTHLFDKNPSGLHNNLNPRLELHGGVNDELPVKVSHYS